MRYKPMYWYSRANMAALGGGADIMPDMANEDWLDWMDSRHVSDWTDAEMLRYRELTGQTEDTNENPD